MKTLYLHGLYAKPSTEKIELLEKDFTLQVSAPEIDYEKYVDSLELFDSLVRKIADDNIRIIIGSSFGGYIGFFLSEFCMIPGYFFNPALIKKSVQVPVRYERNDIKKFVILGKHDDVIDHNETKNFLWEQKYKNTTIIEEDFGHQTDVNQFGSLLQKTDLILIK